MVKVPQSPLSILMPIDRPDESDASVQSGSMPIPVPGAHFDHSPTYTADSQASPVSYSTSQGPTIASPSITAIRNTNSTKGNTTTVSPSVATASYVLSAETECLSMATSSSHVAPSISLRPSVLAPVNNTNSGLCQSCIPAPRGGSRSIKMDPTSDDTVLILIINFLLTLMLF